MQTFLRLMQALADETRLRIMMALRHSELCVCQIQSLLKLAPSTVSVHMRVLHQAGLVAKRRQGKWVYFRLATEESTPQSRATFRLVARGLATCPRIESDRRKLQKLLTQTPQNVCSNEKINRRRRNGGNA